MTTKSSTTYYEKGSEEAVAETALTINRLEQVSPDKRQKNPRFMHVGTSTFSTQLSFSIESLAVHTMAAILSLESLGSDTMIPCTCLIEACVDKGF